MIDKRYTEVLKQLNSILYDSSINWGIGGSLLLALKGIETTIRDIDIVVDSKDMELLITTLRENNLKYSLKGPKHPSNSNALIAIMLNDIEVEFIVGFKILDYHYPEGDNLVSEWIAIDNLKVPLCNIGDWYDVYFALQRNEKLKIIIEYLENDVIKGN